MPRERRFMLCTGECVTAERLADYPRSHVIGEMCYVVNEGHKVTALKLYETSTRGHPGEHPHVRVYLIGDAYRARCTHPFCNHKVRWVAGKAALVAMIDELLRRTGHSAGATGGDVRLSRKESGNGDDIQ